MTEAARWNGVINAGRRRIGLSRKTIEPLAKLASGCARVLIRSLVDCAI